MSKVVRNLSTASNREFWDSAEQIAAKAQNWPASRRAGINVSAYRSTEPNQTNSMMTRRSTAGTNRNTTKNPSR